MSIIIKVIDTGEDDYRIQAPIKLLGCMYDDKAEKIKVEIPKCEKKSTCTMLIETLDREVIDHRTLSADTLTTDIDYLLSQYPTILIGFSFERTDGSIKNSEYQDFSFIESLDPTTVVPMTPEQIAHIDQIKNNAITRVGWNDNNGNLLEFKNYYGTVLSSIDIGDFQQEQADLGETDSSKETFIKNKKTSNLENDSGFITKSVDNLENYTKTSDLPTKVSQFTNDAHYIDKDVNNLTNYTKTTDLPTKVSQFTNDSGYITKSVDNLENYTKTSDLPTKVSEFTNDSEFIDKDVDDLTHYTKTENVGNKLGLNLNSNNYQLTIQLKNSNGTVLDEQLVDLPIEDLFAQKENVSNKITALNGASTDTQYPSAKLLDALITDLVRRITFLETAIFSNIDRETRHAIYDIYNSQS